MHDKIERLIELTGTSQNQLADSVGIRRASLSELKSGKWKPSALQAFRLARALGVSVDFLLDESQDEMPTVSMLDQHRWIFETIQALGFHEAKRRLLRPLNEKPAEREAGEGVELGNGGIVKPAVYPAEKRSKEA